MTELSKEMTALRNATTRVQSLLDDPQQGQSEWNNLLREACLDTQKALCSLGCTPAACGVFLDGEQIERSVASGMVTLFNRSDKIEQPINSGYRELSMPIFDGKPDNK